MGATATTDAVMTVAVAVTGVVMARWLHHVVHLIVIQLYICVGLELPCVFYNTNQHSNRWIGEHSKARLSALPIDIDWMDCF